MRLDSERYSVRVHKVFEFGIIDPDDEYGKSPAIIVYDKAAAKWNAIAIQIIDNNIELTRCDAVASDAKRCDAALYTDKTICLIKLKNQRENWLSNAIEQLGSTIEYFKEDLGKFSFKKAYVCNIAHPRSSYQISNSQSEFYKKHRFVLRTKVDIDELI